MLTTPLTVYCIEWWGGSRWNLRVLDDSTDYVELLKFLETKKVKHLTHWEM